MFCGTFLQSDIMYGTISLTSGPRKEDKLTDPSPTACKLQLNLTVIGPSFWRAIPFNFVGPLFRFVLITLSVAVVGDFCCKGSGDFSISIVCWWLDLVLAAGEPLVGVLVTLDRGDLVFNAPDALGRLGCGGLFKPSSPSPSVIIAGCCGYVVSSSTSLSQRALLVLDAALPWETGISSIYPSGVGFTDNNPRSDLLDIDGGESIIILADAA